MELLSTNTAVQALLCAQTDPEAHAAFEKLGHALDARDVRPLLPALAHPLTMVRRHAAYLLGGRWKDKRVVRPLLDVLRNLDEDPEVRGAIADQLAHHRRRRMILPTLIAASRDANPEVRFWCVFALGSQVRYQRKPSLAAIRALESRLDDTASVPGWWQVRLEAIAMLEGLKKSRASHLFQATMRQVMDNPAADPEKWRWAQHYVEWWGTLNALESASRKLLDAGWNPVTFGGGVEGAWTTWPVASRSNTGP